MRKDPPRDALSPDRRKFLAGASLGGVAMAGSAAAAPAAPPPAASPLSSGPSQPARALEVGPPDDDRPSPSGGSDYMVDALRNLGIRHVAQLPGATFDALQESVINHGMVTEPAMEMFTCAHEELAVAFAHGYAKVTGEPMAAMIHASVGLQHASMGIYNAYCDLAPVVVLTGAQTDAGRRQGLVDWTHAVSDGPGLVRDFVKFDETPRSLAHYADALGRSYRIAMTPPYGPVLLAVDLDLQEQPLPPGQPLPVLRKPTIMAPQGDSGGVREAAKLLASAERPAIVVDRAARTPEGLRLVVELAETLQAAVVDTSGRLNFPWRHPLNQSSRRAAVLREADVVLALEVQDFRGATAAAAKARKIKLDTSDYYIRSNYQSFQAFSEPELTIAGDPQATLPNLIEEVRRRQDRSAKSKGADRRRLLTDAHAAALVTSREAAAVGWNDSPITTARMVAEIYDQVRDLDWSLVSDTVFQNAWPQQLWDAKAHHQYIGGSGGYGLGYTPGAAVGAAFANKEYGRISIAIIGDGEFLTAPGGLWTAVYHQIPVLFVIHNNGGFHQELMKIQNRASRRDRGVKRARIGTELPGLDYAAMGRSMGAFGERVTEPGALRSAVSRALQSVRSGTPALLDVVSQGR